MHKLSQTIENQKTLDVITGEILLETIKTGILLYALSTLCSKKNVSNKLHKNLSVLSVEFIGFLIFLISGSSDMETNSFNINLKLK